MITLIMGRSGAGKTTFYQKIKNSLGSHLYLNADEIRTLFNDWDFSIEGRLRQAIRMKKLADMNSGLTVIDMICPLKEMRTLINPDVIIWVDRKSNGKYKDTDNIFEPPMENEALWSFYHVRS